MKKFVICFLIILLVFLGSLTFAFQTAKKKTQISDDLTRDKIESAVPVSVSPVVMRDFEEKLSAVGTLKARETVILSPKVSGSVETVLVDIGRQVVENQVVVRINTTHYDLAVQQADAAFAGAAAMVSNAGIQFKHAEKQYLRATRLMAEKVISRIVFEETEAAFKSATEQLAAAEEDRNRALSAVRMAKQSRMDADIRSPISGVVVERNVEKGQAVAPGAPLLRIIDQTSLKVDVQLPEPDFSRIPVGTDAVVEMDAFKGERFYGKVALVNPMIDSQTRTFKVRVEVSNPDDRLVEGMFVRISLLLGKRRSPSVPRDAVTDAPESGTSHVFLVNDGIAVKRSVETGIIGDAYTEILKNLDPGDIIITSATGRLRSGAHVIVK
jgi:RND family efflux transporter MFP subunit